MIRTIDFHEPCKPPPPEPISISQVRHGNQVRKFREGKNWTHRQAALAWRMSENCVRRIEAGMIFTNWAPKGMN